MVKRELIDLGTTRNSSFCLTTRHDPWRYGPYCVGCGQKVESHVGQMWIYSTVSLDDTLCEACGEMYAPLVMRQIREYYDYIEKSNTNAGK